MFFFSGLTWVADRSLLSTNIPTSLDVWLRDPRSMTQRMKQVCHTVTIERLNEEWQDPEPMEGERLQTDDKVWRRDVIMRADGEDWLYARTVIPKQSMALHSRDFTELGDKPMGELLFDDPSIQRSIYKYALIPSHMVNSKQILITRTSTFLYKKARLLLTEVFLPKMMRYFKATIKGSHF